MTPFAQDDAETIAALGEASLIEKIKEWLGPASLPPPYGIGDDCAVIAPQKVPSKGLVTADPVIYGRHFDDALGPEQVAIKLLRRNISDIAAMGGKPKHAILCWALDPRVSISWIERFHLSLSQECQRFSAALIGGDVSSSPGFTGAFLTLYGEMEAGVEPLLRNGAQEGSPILVSGTLGGSRLSKHHSFEPRLAEGQWLAQSGSCLSCADLSDGLGKDFINLLPTNLSLQVDCQKIPISEDAIDTATRTGKDPLYHVFNDGEDFELLFALSPQCDLDEFLEDWGKRFPTPVSVIGRAVTSHTGQPRLQLIHAPEPFKTTGYDHLGKA